MLEENTTANCLLEEECYVDEEVSLVNEKSSEELIKECHDFMRKTKTYFEKNRRFLNKFGEMLKAVADSLECFGTVMQSVKNTNDNVDETLCNVLLAIRQNEYLQAWHPKQDEHSGGVAIGKYLEV